MCEPWRSGSSCTTVGEMDQDRPGTRIVFLKVSLQVIINYAERWLAARTALAGMLLPKLKIPISHSDQLNGELIHRAGLTTHPGPRFTWHKEFSHPMIRFTVAALITETEDIFQYAESANKTYALFHFMDPQISLATIRSDWHFT